MSLYRTQSDAENETNVVASSSGGYGLSIEIILPEIPRFLDIYNWNLVVSGLAGDEQKIFRVKPFVEGDEISGGIFRNSSLALVRATEEIDEHSMMRKTRSLTMGIHFPTLETGTIGQISNNRRSRVTKGWISRNEIVFNITDDGSCSLINQIEMNEWIQLRR